MKTVELGAKIDADTMKELVENEPQHVGDVVDRLMVEAENSFPVFGLFAVYDLALGAYVDPQFHVNDMVAYRDFRTQLLSGNSRFTATPEDFRLDYLGQWDQETGEMIVDEARVIGTVKEILDGERTS